MALGERQSDNKRHKITGDELAAISSSFALGKHIELQSFPGESGMLYQTQKLEEDIKTSMPIDKDYQDPMDEVLAENLVEVIATMNQEQRDKFVDTFVSKWPKLASQVSFNIDVNLQEVMSVN